MHSVVKMDMDSSRIAPLTLHGCGEYLVGLTQQQQAPRKQRIAMTQQAVLHTETTAIGGAVRLGCHLINASNTFERMLCLLYHAHSSAMVSAARFLSACITLDCA